MPRLSQCLGALGNVCFVTLGGGAGERGMPTAGSTRPECSVLCNIETACRRVRPCEGRVHDSCMMVTD